MYKTASIALRKRSFKSIYSLAVVGVLAFVMYYRIQDIDIEGSIIDFGPLAFLLLFIIPLSPLNLLCEMRKWQILIPANIPSRQLFRAILKGMSLGLLTPNRIGEFPGRVISLPREHRNAGAIAMAVGSSLQGFTTLVFGLVGLFIFPSVPDFGVVNWAWIIPSGLAIIGLIIYLHKGLSRILLRAIVTIKSYNMRLIASAALWAFIRYSIFTIQFVVALYAFGYQGSFFFAISGVFLLYLIQSYTPLTTFGDIGVREVLAIVLFGSFFSNPLMPAISAFSVWVANIGLPVLCSLFVFSSDQK